MLAQYPGAQGVKTGYTGDAGLCLVTSAARDGRRIVSVLLNAPHWVDDSTALLDYGFARLAAAPTSKPDERVSIAKRAVGRLPR
jgi:D-alanyl-D-alanine carboxypeptidase (penicillin-binding protein 5/6)